MPDMKTNNNNGLRDGEKVVKKIHSSEKSNLTKDSMKVSASNNSDEENVGDYDNDDEKIHEESDGDTNDDDDDVDVEEEDENEHSNLDSSDG